jgi:hypothetical protein
MTGEFVRRDDFFKYMNRFMTVDEYKADREDQRKVARDMKMVMTKVSDESTRALHEMRRIEENTNRKADLRQLVKLEVSLEAYAKEMSLNDVRDSLNNYATKLSL